MEEFTSEDTAFTSKWLVRQGFKSYAVFLGKKKSLIFVVQLPINIMRILSVQAVAGKIPAGLFIVTEQG